MLINVGVLWLYLYSSTNFVQHLPNPLRNTTLTNTTFLKDLGGDEHKYDNKIKKVTFSLEISGGFYFN